MLSNKEALEKAIKENPTLSIEVIKHNNGFTRIEPDGSNLPTDESVKYKVGKFSKGHFEISVLKISVKQVELCFKELGDTHYKIEKELLPIY